MANISGKKTGKSKGSEVKCYALLYNEKEIEVAFDTIEQAIKDRVISTQEGLVEMRNNVAEDIRVRIQNKIWENKSIVTGRLWGSIEVNPPYLDPKAENSLLYPQDIGTNVYYAKYLEGDEGNPGTKPFMRPVWAEVKPRIVQRMYAAFERGIEG